MTIRRIQDILIGRNYKPGIKFEFSIAIPEANVDEYALLVEHDRENDANINSMLALAEEGKAPYCISVGVSSGKLTMSDGSVRNMRMNSYDLFDREYADFIVLELIPHIVKTYGLPISVSPDMHMVSGGSSGGISAFAIAWFHPDYFHRVYMSSPSFLAMGRGNEFPYLIRKYETKPLRIYQEFSENEPNDYFGWSRSIDEEADAALAFAGYDYQCKYFEGEGHCSRYKDLDQAYIRNEWIWRDWKTKPIVAPSNSPRVARVIPFGSKWERCASFPGKNCVKVPSVLEIYDSAVLSNDGLAWYCADKNDDIIHMNLANEHVDTKRSLLHSTLHTISRYYPKGAIDMVIDGNDRLYVLTAIGIQCVRSYGLIDVILNLPDDSMPVAICITDALYVETEKGVYRRRLCEDCTDFDTPRRNYTSYYD